MSLSLWGILFVSFAFRTGNDGWYFISGVYCIFFLPRALEIFSAVTEKRNTHTHTYTHRERKRERERERAREAKRMIEAHKFIAPTIVLCTAGGILLRNNTNHYYGQELYENMYKCSTNATKK